MQISREREAELLEKNMPKIYRAVDNFTARCSCQVVRVPYEDLVQEVAIAFLGYIRRCETEEALDTFPWYDATHAMSELVLRCQPLSVPVRTSTFSAIVKSMPATMSLDDISPCCDIVDGLSKHWVEDKETQIDFEAFMASQTENLNRVSSMKLHGMNNKQVAGQCGVSRQSVNNWLNKMRDEYKEFMGGE